MISPNPRRVRFQDDTTTFVTLLNELQQIPMDFSGQVYPLADCLLQANYPMQIITDKDQLVDWSGFLVVEAEGMYFSRGYARAIGYLESEEKHYDNESVRFLHLLVPTGCIHVGRSVYNVNLERFGPLKVRRLRAEECKEVIKKITSVGSSVKMEFELDLYYHLAGQKDIGDCPTIYKAFLEYCKAKSHNNL